MGLVAVAPHQRPVTKTRSTKHFVGGSSSRERGVSFPFEQPRNLEEGKSFLICLEDHGKVEIEGKGKGSRQGQGQG